MFIGKSRERGNSLPVTWPAGDINLPFGRKRKCFHMSASSHQRDPNNKGRVYTQPRRDTAQEPPHRALGADFHPKATPPGLDVSQHLGGTPGPGALGSGPENLPLGTGPGEAREGPKRKGERDGEGSTKPPPCRKCRSPARTRTPRKGALQRVSSAQSLLPAFPFAH